MSNSRVAVLSLIAAIALLSPLLPAQLPQAVALGAPPQAQGVPTSSPSLMFIENEGQWTDGARFQVRGGAEGTAWLADDAIWLTIMEPAKQEETRSPLDSGQGRRWPVDEPRLGANLKLSFVGANPHPVLEPFDRLDPVVSYFLGDDPDEWRPDVPVWGGVRYKDLYPGVNLELTSEGGHHVQRLVVADGADLAGIGLRVYGAEVVGFDMGSLKISTAAGDLVLPLFEVLNEDGTPYNLGSIHPSVRGTEVRAPVASISAPMRAAESDYSVPGLIFSTLVGGSGYDGDVGWGGSVAVDTTGAITVMGHTESSDFPTSVGAFDPSADGALDAYVFKLSADGSSLLYSTFLGGSGEDSANSVALDSAGNAIVIGTTASPDFPTTAGAYDTSYNGSDDVFVSKLAPDGGSLVYSTFIGGSDLDWGNRLVADGTGAVFVACTTASADFPTSPTAYDRSHNGFYDGCVLKLAPDGHSLVYSTLVGGEYMDCAEAVAIDAAGNAVVTGKTQSADFPTTAGAYDVSYNGGYADVFVLRLGGNGESLGFSTFIGAGNSEYGRSLALAADGGIVLAGLTYSSGFPTTPNAYNSSHNGYCDAFVSKLAADGSALDYSTFVGGSGYELGWSLILDSAENALITGYTESGDFPIVPGAYDATFNGSYDAYLIKLARDGQSLLYSTYLGGGSGDFGWGLGLDSSGSVIVVGNTGSSDFPTSDGAYDTSHNGSADAFVLKLSSLGMEPALELSLASLTFLVEAGMEAPLPRTLELEGQGGVLGWEAAVNPPTSWLQIAPTSGWTPAAINVAVDTTGLPVGRYDASIVVTPSSGVVGGPQTVGVTLVVASEIQKSYLPLVAR